MLGAKYGLGVLLKKVKCAAVCSYALLPNGDVQKVGWAVGTTHISFTQSICVPPFTPLYPVYPGPTYLTQGTIAGAVSSSTLRLWPAKDA